MVKRAIIIGINYTGTDSELYGCQNDARSLRKLLIESYGYEPFDIKVLIDRFYGTYLLPTKQNIESTLAWVVQQTQPGDTVFFSFSGHGLQLRDRSGDESDGKDEQICPLDFEWSGFMSDDWFRSTFVDRLPAGSKLFCLFDSCNSGTMLDLRYHLRLNAPTAEGYTGTLLQNSTIQSTNCEVVCLSGCLDHQTSADSWFDDGYAGALTWTFLYVLKSIRGDIDHVDLLAAVSTRLKAEGFTQIPQLSFGRSITVHELVKF